MRIYNNEKGQSSANQTDEKIFEQLDSLRVSISAIESELTSYETEFETKNLTAESADVTGILNASTVNSDDVVVTDLQVANITRVRNLVADGIGEKPILSADENQAISFYLTNDNQSLVFSYLEGSGVYQTNTINGIDKVLVKKYNGVNYFYINKTKDVDCFYWATSIDGKPFNASNQHQLVDTITLKSDKTVYIGEVNYPTVNFDTLVADILQVAYKQSFTKKLTALPVGTSSEMTLLEVNNFIGESQLYLTPEAQEPFPLVITLTSDNYNKNSEVSFSSDIARILYVSIDDASRRLKIYFESFPGFITDSTTSLIAAIDNFDYTVSLVDKTDIPTDAETYTNDGKSQFNLTFGDSIVATLQATDIITDSITAEMIHSDAVTAENITAENLTANDSEVTGILTAGTTVSPNDVYNSFKIPLVSNPATTRNYIAIPSFSGSIELWITNNDDVDDVYMFAKISRMTSVLTKDSISIDFSVRAEGLFENVYVDKLGEILYLKVNFPTDATGWYSYHVFQSDVPSYPENHVGPLNDYVEEPSREYEVKYSLAKTAFIGDGTEVTGVDIVGQLETTSISFPGDVRFRSVLVDERLEAAGEVIFSNVPPVVNTDEHMILGVSDVDATVRESRMTFNDSIVDFKTLDTKIQDPVTEDSITNRGYVDAEIKEKVEQFGYATNSIAVSDFNTAVVNGWYQGTGSTTNTPNDSLNTVWFLLVKGDSANLLQECINFNNQDSAWIRRKSNTTWGAWQEVGYERASREIQQVQTNLTNHMNNTTTAHGSTPTPTSGRIAEFNSASRLSSTPGGTGNNVMTVGEAEVDFISKQPKTVTFAEINGVSLDSGLYSCSLTDAERLQVGLEDGAGAYMFNHIKLVSGSTSIIVQHAYRFNETGSMVPYFRMYYNTSDTKEKIFSQQLVEYKTASNRPKTKSTYDATTIDQNFGNVKTITYDTLQTLNASSTLQAGFYTLAGLTTAQKTTLGISDFTASSQFLLNICTSGVVTSDQKYQIIYDGSVNGLFRSRMIYSSSDPKLIKFTTPKVATPTGTTDIANKEYVDDLFTQAAKVANALGTSTTIAPSQAAVKTHTDNTTSAHGATVTPTAQRIAKWDNELQLNARGAYNTGTNGTVLTSSDVSAVTSVTGNRLPRYDEGGRLKANTPVDTNDVANKVYVDAEAAEQAKRPASSIEIRDISSGGDDQSIFIDFGSTDTIDYRARLIVEPNSNVLQYINRNGMTGELTTKSGGYQSTARTYTNMDSARLSEFVKAGNTATNTPLASYWTGITSHYDANTTIQMLTDTYNRTYTRRVSSTAGQSTHWKPLMSSDYEPTFVVSSQDDFNKWKNNTSGYNYKHILIMPGTYTGSGDLTLDIRGTETVIGVRGGQGDINPVISLTNGNLRYENEIPLDSMYLYRIENIDVVMSRTIAGTGACFVRCVNLVNCNTSVTSAGASGTVFGYYLCTNLTNCSGTTNSSLETSFTFSTCNTLYNCKSFSSALNFDYCDNLVNCVVVLSDNPRRGFNRCDYKTNCSVIVTAPILFDANFYGFFYGTNSSNCSVFIRGAAPNTSTIITAYDSEKYLSTCGATIFLDKGYIRGYYFCNNINSSKVSCTVSDGPAYGYDGCEQLTNNACEEVIASQTSRGYNNCIGMLLNSCKVGPVPFNLCSANQGTYNATYKAANTANGGFNTTN